MEFFVIALVVAAVGGRFARVGLAKLGLMKSLPQARADKDRAMRLGWEAKQLKADLDRSKGSAGMVAADSFMPSVGDFLLAAESEPVTKSDRRCRKAVDAIRLSLEKDFGFDAAAFASMRDKAQARADKRLRKAEKRTGAKKETEPRPPARRESLRR